jgi:hypothetical protein
LKSTVEPDALISATSSVVEPAVRWLFLVTLPIRVVELLEAQRSEAKAGDLEP